MKRFQDFLVTMLTVACAQAAGSGPYLPSGWRPDGPGFLLPGEIHESPPVSLKNVQESLAAGSDSLREYGPPKFEEVSQDITQQALPDEAAAPPFYIIRSDIGEDISGAEGEEVTTEQETIDEASLDTTKSPVDDNTETQSEIKGKSIKLDSVETVSKDGETESRVEKTDKTSDIKADNDTAYITVDSESVKETSNTATQTEASSQKITDNTESEETTDNHSESETEVYMEYKSDITESLNEAQVKSALVVDDTKKYEFSHVNTEDFKQEQSDKIDVDEDTDNANNEAFIKENTKERSIVSGVNNIAEALVNLEKEITDQKDQKDAEVKKVADNEGNGQPFPEGFLEYGPPGFKEYGPPTLTKLSEKHPSTGNEVDNEVRRRRFSPKFKITSNKNH